jgi:hypothetical protein
MLLEKAYAKLYKGYWNIGTGGCGDEALGDLTGAPCESFDLNDKATVSTMWKKLMSYDKRNYVMTISTKGSGEVKNS